MFEKQARLHTQGTRRKGKGGRGRERDGWGVWGSRVVRGCGVDKGIRVSRCFGVVRVFRVVRIHSDSVRGQV